MMQPFTTAFRVRHYEMDALGHVNNATYQHYLEQAAIEHSEQVGLGIDQYKQLGGIFVMRRIEIDYLRSAVAGDVLVVKTWIQQMRGSCAIRCYEVYRQGDQEPILTAEAIWVWVDTHTLRPRPIPDRILTAYEQLAAAGDR